MMEISSRRGAEVLDDSFMEFLSALTPFGIFREGPTMTTEGKCRSKPTLRRLRSEHVSLTLLAFPLVRKTPGIASRWLTWTNRTTTAGQQPESPADAQR